jgi:predicted MFS family arabinose efflux permease
MLSPLSLLVIAAAAANIADQLTLSALTLLAAATGVPPASVSLIVAVQSAAWLLVSLPVGAYADRMPRKRLLLGGALCVVAGGGLAALAITSGLGFPWLAAAAFLASAGLVVISLVAMALTPVLVARDRLPTANARLELGRAAGTLAAPSVAAAVLLAGAPALPFLLAAGCGLVCLAAAGRLPALPPASASSGVLRAIADGGRFVARNHYLRAIAVCAICWNAAFFALLSIFASYAIGTRGLDLATTGLVWSAYGAGLIVGTLAAAPLVARLKASTLMVFGPASSLAGVVVFALAPAAFTAPAAVLAFFGLGFGPILWQITQSTVRQIVTPDALMGRVTATLATATWGMRPVGALAAGLAASAFGVEAAIWLPVALFTLSLLAILLSPFPRLDRLSELTPARE